jgi:hypothetical protein
VGVLLPSASSAGAISLPTSCNPAGAANGSSFFTPALPPSFLFCFFLPAVFPPPPPAAAAAAAAVFFGWTKPSVIGLAAFLKW